MNENNVEINGAEYSIGRLDAMKQFHLARKLMPMLLKAGVNAQDFLGKKEEDFEVDALIEKILGPLVEEISRRTDEEIEHIIYPCLDVVTRKQGPAWAKVKASGQNALMFPDMDASVILRLTFEVIQRNLASFFPSGQPQASETRPA